MKIHFTQHAQQRMELRNILEEWIFLTIIRPDTKVDHGINPTLVYHFKTINEANNKTLRVVLKKLDLNDEYLILTCYFDKKMRIIK